MLKKLIVVCLLVLACGLTFAQNLPPKSNTLVTDSTGTLSEDEKASLEAKLVAFDDSTSTQIAVVILTTIGNADINQYGAALLRAWGIGQKDKNNGILILVAIADHKVSIQTGYGAEAAVPDIVTHDIIANDITPNFKQGKYYDGLDLATTSLMQHMSGEYKGTGKPQAANGQAVNNNESSNTGGAIAVIIIVIVVLIIIFRGRGGGGGHIIGRRGGASPFWWFLAGSALGSSSNNGGGFFGGDSGGGGFGDGGGGGFGGFGGGSGGGGGSSGSW